MTHKITKALAVIIFLTVGCTPGLLGQTSGSVAGRVSDPTLAALPGTTISLKNVETGTERTTVTTGAGDYTFTEVPVGVYTISASHAGFKIAASTNVEVQVQQSVRLDFALQVGDITQSIEIQASGALLQADNATLGTVIDNAAVTEIPLNGRNYLGLVALASNVNTLSPTSGQAGSRLGGDRAAQAISVGGQRIMFDYYTLDGVTNTDPDFNTYIGLPSLDGIQEFKVQTGVYPAEFGHEASQVNVVSKTGTNAYHGSAYDFIRNNIADASPYFFPYNAAPPKVYPFKWNDYGFELDGAVRIPKLYDGRNKFFFMVDDEWRNVRQVGQGSATVPTPALAAGNFSGFTNAAGQPVTIYDPATGNAQGLGKTPFPNNTIPAARISPISTALLKYLGTNAGAFYNTAGQVIPNYTYSTSAPQDRQSLTVRGDYFQSERSQFAFRYSAGNETLISTGLLGAGSKTVTQYYQYMGSNTFTLSPRLVNEARFGYSHFFNSTGLLSAFTNDVVAGLNIPGLSDGLPSTWGIPSVSFSSGPAGTNKAIWSAFGDLGGDGPYVVNDPTIQGIDNVSYVKGRHDFRFGAEYNHQTFNQLGNQFSRGLFGTEPLATGLEVQSGSSVTYAAPPTGGVSGDSLADFLLGQLYQSTVAVAVANANYVRNVWAFYGEDTFKATPKLTISAGLRYELTPPWNDTLGDNFVAYVPNKPTLGATSTTFAQSQWPFYVRQGNCTPANVYQGLAIVWTSPLGPQPTCSNGLLPNGPLLDTQYFNFAPRLGISYSPNPKLVLRTGYGIFYNQDIGNAYFDMARNIAGRVTQTNTDSLSGNSNLSWNNAAPGGSGAIARLPPSVAFDVAPSHKTTYTEQYLLNIQQQVGQDWSFEIGYQGAVHRHLYGFQNLNQATPFGYLGTGTATSVASRTPFANMGGIQNAHDMGAGNYNALSVKANRRFSHGFTVIASYTWSKSLDDTSGIRNQGNDELYPQNSYCIRCEYGPSAFDVRNRIVGSALYELPIGVGKLVPVNRFLDVLIGGWQVGGIFTHQTGGVATPLLGVDNASISSPFGNFDRPIPTGTSPYLAKGTRTLNDWVNAAAYAQAPKGLFGSVGRGSFVGPGFTNFDASLHKDLKMPYNEKHMLSIRFEAFNALNHPNWNTPNLTTTSSTFGRINGTASMRQLQLAAKYHF